MGKAMVSRHKLSDFAGKIHNIFGLQEQVRQLLTLITEAVGCKWACLLFPEADSKDFASQLCESGSGDSPLPSLKMDAENPIVEHLRQEKKLLTKQSLVKLPEFQSVWQRGAGEIKIDEIELFVPLISRERLVAILVLAEKQSGGYSVEDSRLLKDVADQVAVSIDKEYLREQLSQHEERLSILNRCNAIITSSMDISEVFDTFVGELKKVVDVSWAAVVLIENSDLYFQALSTEIDSTWKVGERELIKGTAVEWVINHKKAMVESDLSQESQFVMAKSYLKQGLRSIVYLPLIAKGKAIGSLIVASRHPNAYSQRHMILLEQLASQIAMPIEHSRLYAEVKEKARVDELTGLLNRRSLDEMIVSEINRHSRYGSVFSLIILDLDSFKAFNDNYGHLAGDELLREIGSVLKDSVRGADQAFRYGGDEFAILLPSTLINAANRVAERIRKRVASKEIADYIPVTVSLGLASCPVNGRGVNEIIAAADAALYHAKRSGGNRSHCSENVQ